MASNQETNTPIPFSQTKYWDREYKLEIVDGEEIIADYNTTLVKANLGCDPFDIKFHVVSTGGITPTFTIEILGLSQATMNKLLMWNVGTSFARGIKIKLYAGYKGIGSGPLPLIAQGVIVQAFPISAPPEVWFRLVCITNGEFNTPILKPKYSYAPSKANGNNTESTSKEQDLNPDSPIKTYPADEAIEKELNVIRNKVEEDGGTLSIDIKDGVLDWVGKKATTLIDGAGKTITELANAIQDKYGVVVALAIQTASLVVYCTKRIDKMKEATPPEDAPIINAMDGLLSVGNLEYGGFVCSVTRLLNADLSIGKFCRLESKLMPGYSGRFLVTSVRYIGHYRGREWFTRLSLVKVDASDKK